jgi:phosphoglycerate dehydrogenase-like enzyme
MEEKHSVLFLTERGSRHQQAALAAAPAELDVTMLREPPREEVLRRLPEVEFLISERSGLIDAEMIAAGGKLRLIQRLGSLTYDIDLDAARAAGVPVCARPVRTVILVAEHMLMQMLALTKRLNQATAVTLEAGDWGQASRRTDEDTFAYNWSSLENVGGIYGLTVGILGLGEIGAELARRLRGFAPEHILYHKRRRLPEPAEAELGLTYVSVDQLFARSDILCNLLPFFPETDGSINADVFARMKLGSYLVSCGSGSVIDEAALAEALRAGQLAGAALDTYEWEPIRPDNPLLPLARDPGKNVLLTPHTAAGSVPAATGAVRRGDFENIRRLLRGQPLLHRLA